MRKIFLLVFTLFLISCSKQIFNQKWTHEKAPDNFIARFETTKGNFDIEITRDGSPMAVDRFYQLVHHHFYDNTIFYRAVPNFVVQFGNGDTIQSHKWDKFKVPDEKVKMSNLKGALSYARSGEETRGNDLFINLKDNQRLDTVNYEKVRGFPAFGKVIKGMEVVEAIYTGYSNETMEKYDSLSPNRTEFLKTFPKLDLLHKVYVLKKVNKIKTKPTP